MQMWVLHLLIYTSMPPCTIHLTHGTWQLKMSFSPPQYLVGLSDLKLKKYGNPSLINPRYSNLHLKSKWPNQTQTHYFLQMGRRRWIPLFFCNCSCCHSHVNMTKILFMPFNLIILLSITLFKYITVDADILCTH